MSNDSMPNPRMRKASERNSALVGSLTVSQSPTSSPEHSTSVFSNLAVESGR